MSEKKDKARNLMFLRTVSQLVVHIFFFINEVPIIIYKSYRPHQPHIFNLNYK